MPTTTDAVVMFHIASTPHTTRRSTRMITGADVDEHVRLGLPGPIEDAYDRVDRERAASLLWSGFGRLR